VSELQGTGGVGPLSLSLNMGFSDLFGVFDSVGLCPFSLTLMTYITPISLSLLFSSILLQLYCCKTNNK